MISPEILSGDPAAAAVSAIACLRVFTEPDSGIALPKLWSGLKGTSAFREIGKRTTTDYTHDFNKVRTITTTSLQEFLTSHTSRNSLKTRINIIIVNRNVDIITLVPGEAIVTLLMLYTHGNLKLTQ